MANTGEELQSSEALRNHEVTKLEAFLRALVGGGFLVAIFLIVLAEVPNDPTRWRRFEGWTLGQRVIFWSPFALWSMYGTAIAVLSWFWPIYIRTSPSWFEVRDVFWRLKRCHFSSVDQVSSNLDHKWSLRLAIDYRYGKQIRISKLFAGSSFEAIREDVRSRLAHS